jgi:hypothetical protein
MVGGPDDVPPIESLRTVADGEVLFLTRNGLRLIRRRKHEWTDSLQRLDPSGLARATDKVRGSKFGPAWTLDAYVRWLIAQVDSLGWDEQTAAGSVLLELDGEVGWSNGRPVRRVRIVISSRSVHAYPVQE